MLKKLIKGTIVAGALLAFAGTASAATYEVAIGGASAQGSFWKTASKAFMTNVLGCTSAQIEGKSKKGRLHLGPGLHDRAGRGPAMTRFTSGTIRRPPTGAAKPLRAARPSMPQTRPRVIGRRKRTGDCSGSKSVRLTIGCADVACSSLTQTTWGWQKRKKCGRHR